MAIYTQLSPTATPGKRYSFSAKTAAAVSGPHTGLFTALSVTATPGQIQSFTAKAEAAPAAGPHTGLFTNLSVMAVPGIRQSFVAKAETEIAYEAVVARRYPGSGISAGEWEYKERAELQKRILEDDNEIFEILASILPTLN